MNDYTQHAAEEVDRPRGIFSEADRKHLLGENEYGSRNAELNARNRIRERIYNAMLDFTLIEGYLQGEDYRKAFADRFVDDSVTGSTEDPKPFIEYTRDKHLAAAVRNQLHFILWSIVTHNINPGPLLESILTRAVAFRGLMTGTVRYPEVDVSIETGEGTPVEEFIQEIEDSDELTDEQQKWMELFAFDDVDDLKNYLQEKTDAFELERESE